MHASVGSINEADSNLRAVLEQQTAELDEIALRAGNVAGQVASALPDIRSAVGHVDQAGQSVLGTAEELIDRSQGLVNPSAAISPSRSVHQEFEPKLIRVAP